MSNVRFIATEALSPGEILCISKICGLALGEVRSAMQEGRPVATFQLFNASHDDAAESIRALISSLDESRFRVYEDVVDAVRGTLSHQVTFQVLANILADAEDISSDLDEEDEERS
jgi:hypothetical protein